MVTTSRKGNTIIVYDQRILNRPDIVIKDTNLPDRNLYRMQQKHRHEKVEKLLKYNSLTIEAQRL